MNSRVGNGNGNNVVDLKKKQNPHVNKIASKEGLLFNVKSIFINASERRNYPQIKEITSKASSSVKNFTSAKLGDKSSAKNSEQKKVVIKVSTAQKVASLYLKAIYDVFHLYQKSNNSLVQFAAFLFGFTLATVMVVGTLGLPIIYLSYLKSHATPHANRSNDSLKPFVDKVLNAFIGYMKPLRSEMKEVYSIAGADHRKLIDTFTADLQKTLEELKVSVENLQQDSGTIRKDANRVIQQIDAKKAEYVKRFNEIVKSAFQDLSKNAANNYTEHKSAVDTEIDKCIVKIESIDLPDKNQLLAELVAFKSDINHANIEFKAEAENHFNSEVEQHKLDQKRNDYNSFNQRIAERMEQDENRLKDIIGEIKIKQAQQSGEWEQLMNAKINEYENHVQACEKEIEQVVGGLEGIQFSLTADNLNKRAVKSAKEKLIEVKLVLNKQLTSLKEKLQEKINKNKSENKRFQEQDVTNFSEEISNLIITDNNSVLSNRNIYFKAHIKAEYFGYQQHQINIELELKELSNILDTYDVSEESRGFFLLVTTRIEEDNTSINQYYDRLNGAEDLTSDEVKSFVDGTNNTQEEEVNLVNSLKKDILDQVALSIKQRILNANSKYKESVESLNKQIEQLLINVKEHDDVLGIEQISLRELTERLAKKIDDFELAAKTSTNNPEVLFSKEVDHFIERTVQQSVSDIKDYKEIEAVINNKIQEKFKNQLDETLAQYILHVDKTLPKTKSLLNEIKEVKDAFPHKDEYFYKSLEIDHSAIKNLQDQLIRSSEEFKGKVQMLQNSVKIKKEDIQGLDTAIKKRILEYTNRLSELQHVMNGRLRDIARDAVFYYQDPHITSIKETLQLAERAAVILPNYEDYLAKINSFLKRLEQQYETLYSDEIDLDEDLNIEKVKVFENKIDEQKINDLEALEAIKLIISKDIEILLSAETKQLIDYDSHVKLLKADILRESANIKDELYLQQEMIDFEKLGKVLDESRESFIKTFQGFEVGASNKGIKELNTTINKQIESNIDEYNRILNQTASGRKNYYAGLMTEKLKECEAHIKNLKQTATDTVSKYLEIIADEKKELGDNNEQELLQDVETVIFNNYEDLMHLFIQDFSSWSNNCDMLSRDPDLNSKKAEIEIFITELDQLKLKDSNYLEKWMSNLQTKWDNYNYAKDTNKDIKRYKEHVEKLTHIVNLAFGSEINLSISADRARFISHLSDNYHSLVNLRKGNLGQVKLLPNPKQAFKDHVESLISQDNGELVKLIQLAVVNKYSEFKLSKEKIEGEFKQIRTEITGEFAIHFAEFELASLTTSEGEFNLQSGKITEETNLLSKKTDISTEDIKKYSALIDGSLDSARAELGSIKKAVSMKWGQIAKILVEDYKGHLDSEIAAALELAKQSSKLAGFTAEIVKLHGDIRAAQVLSKNLHLVHNKIKNKALVEEIGYQKRIDEDKLQGILQRLSFDKSQSEQNAAAAKDASVVVMSYFNDISDQLLELHTAVQGLSTELATDKESLIKKIDNFATKANNNIIKFQKAADEVTDDDKNKFLDKVSTQKQSDAKKVDELRKAYHELKVQEIKLKIIEAVAFYEKHAKEFPPRVNVLSKQYKWKPKFEALLNRLEVLNKSVATSKEAYVKESKMIIKTLKLEHQESADTFITNIKKQIEAYNNDISAIEKELKDQELLNLQDKAGRLVENYAQHTVDIANSLQTLKQEFGEIAESPAIGKLFAELTETMSIKPGEFNSDLNSIKERKTLTEQDISTFEKQISNQVGQDKSKLEELNKAVRGMVKEEKLKKFAQSTEKYRNNMATVLQSIGEIKADIDQEPIPGFDPAKIELNRLEESMRRSLSELDQIIKTIANKPSIPEEEIKGFDELVDSKIKSNNNKIGEVRNLVSKELELIAKHEVEQYKTHLDPKISDLEIRIATAGLGDQSDEISSALGYLKASIHEPQALSKIIADDIKKVGDLRGFRGFIANQKNNDEVELENINKAFLELLAKVNNAKLHEEIAGLIKKYLIHVSDIEGYILGYKASIEGISAKFNEIIRFFDEFSEDLAVQRPKYKEMADKLSKKGNNLSADDVRDFKMDIEREEVRETHELARILSLIIDENINHIAKSVEDYDGCSTAIFKFLEVQEVVMKRFSENSVARYNALRLHDLITGNKQKINEQANNYYNKNRDKVTTYEAIQFAESVEKVILIDQDALTQLKIQINLELSEWASGQVSEYKDHLNTDIHELRLTIIGSAVPEEARKALLDQVNALEAEIKLAESLTLLSKIVVDEETAVKLADGIKDQKRSDNEKLRVIATEFSKLLEQDQSKKQLNEVLAKYNQHIEESLKTLEQISDVADKPSVKTIMKQIFDKSGDLQQELVTQRGEVGQSPVLNPEEIKKDDVESFTALTKEHILANDKNIEELKKEMIETFKETASTAVGKYKPHLDTEIKEARAEIGKDKDLAAENTTKDEILAAISELEAKIHEAEALSTEASDVTDDISFEALSDNIEVQKGKDSNDLSALMNKFEVEQEAARLGNMGTGYEKSIEEFNADDAASKKASTTVAEYKQELKEMIEKIKKAADEEPNEESRADLLSEIDTSHQEINERLGELEKDSKKVKKDGYESFEKRLNEEKGKTDKELSELEKTIGEKIQNNLKEQVKKSSDEYKEHATGLLREINAALKSVSDDEEEFGEKFEGDSSQLINLKKQVDAHLDKAEKDCEEIVEESPIDKSRLNKFIADLKDKKSSEKDQMKKIESEINTRRQEYFKKKINSLLEEYQSDSRETFEQIINLQKSLEEKFPESDHLGSTLRGALPLEIRAFEVRNSEVEKESTSLLGIAYGKGKLSLFRGLVANNKKHNHDALERLSKSYNGLRAKKSMEQYNEHALNCSRVIGALELNLSYAENREEYLLRLQSLEAKIEDKKSEFTEKSEGLINTAKSDEKEVTEFEGDVTQQIKADRDELDSLQLSIKKVLKNTLRARQEATIKSNQEQAQLRGDYKNLLSQYEEHIATLIKRITQILEKVKPDGVIDKELTSLEMLRERLGTRIDTFKEGLAKLEKAEKVTKEQFGEFKNVFNSQQEHDLREFGGAIAEIQKIKIKTSEHDHKTYLEHANNINTEITKIIIENPKMRDLCDELRDEVSSNAQVYSLTVDDIAGKKIINEDNLVELVIAVGNFSSTISEMIQLEQEKLRQLQIESAQVEVVDISGIQNKVESALKKYNNHVDALAIEIGLLLEKCENLKLEDSPTFLISFRNLLLQKLQEFKSKGAEILDQKAAESVGGVVAEIDERIETDKKELNRLREGIIFEKNAGSAINEEYEVEDDNESCEGISGDVGQTIVNLKKELDKILQSHPELYVQIVPLMERLLKTPVSIKDKLFFIVKSNNLEQYIEGLLQAVKDSILTKNVDEKKFIKVCDHYYYDKDFAGSMYDIRNISKKSLHSLENIMQNATISDDSVIKIDNRSIELLSEVIALSGVNVSKKVNLSFEALYLALNKTFGAEITWGEIKALLATLENTEISHSGQLYLINSALFAATLILGGQDKVSSLNSIWKQFVEESKRPGFIVGYPKIRTLQKLSALFDDINEVNPEASLDIPKYENLELRKRHIEYEKARLVLSKILREKDVFNDLSNIAYKTEGSLIDKLRPKLQGLKKSDANQIKKMKDLQLAIEREYPIIQEPSKTSLHKGITKVEIKDPIDRFMNILFPPDKTILEKDEALDKLSKFLVKKSQILFGAFSDTKHIYKPLNQFGKYNLDHKNIVYKAKKEYTVSDKLGNDTFFDQFTMNMYNTQSVILESEIKRLEKLVKPHTKKQSVVLTAQEQEIATRINKLKIDLKAVNEHKARFKEEHPEVVV